MNKASTSKEIDDFSVDKVYTQSDNALLKTTAGGGGTELVSWWRPNLRKSH
jgi:hypothetical protein